MNETLQDLMRSATKLTQAGRLSEATATIQRALGNAGAAVRATAAHALADASPMVLDGCVFEAREPGSAAAAPAAGAFTSGTHTHAALTRAYKLFVPPGRAARPRALVVMLHGCTQDPDDFAAGTGMNVHALEQDFVVLYPAQSQDANPSRCWNWFKHNHQQRGIGEPALIASMTSAVIKEHDIDPRRVYIAGLSAGGAMATIVAEAYPDIFAAVGVHSGLPRGAANSVPEALSVMNIGVAGTGVQARARRVEAAVGAHVPTIVFHGDQDRTVHPRNGEQVIAAALGGAATGAAHVEQGTSRQGRRYTRSNHVAENGAVRAEHWVLQARATPGRVATRRARTPTPRGPTPHAKCCGFSSSSRCRRSTETRLVLQGGRCAAALHVRWRTDGMPAPGVQAYARRPSVADPCTHRLTATTALRMNPLHEGSA